MGDEARPRPIEDVREISAITYGFMASKALFAALEFDLFTHIARGAVSTSALARASGIAENRLVTLLATLKSLGLISEADGRLINAPATARYLVAGAPGDFRDYIRFVNGEFGYESFRHLGAALRGERIFPGQRILRRHDLYRGNRRRAVQFRATFRVIGACTHARQAARSQGSPQAS